jgi:hypothetical protein
VKVPPRNKGKPGKEVLLPNRGAMNQLTKPQPGKPPPTVLDYGQITPSGLNAPQTYPQLIQMGLTAGKRTV